jgi:hypothetical protein
MPLVRLECQVSKQPLLTSTTEQDTEVKSVTMAKNVLAFRTPGRAVAQSTAREHCRALFQIAGRRFTLDFYVTVNEVNPVDAEILSIQKSPFRSQRSRPQGEQRSGKAPPRSIGGHGR